MKPDKVVPSFYSASGTQGCTLALKRMSLDSYRLCSNQMKHVGKHSVPRRGQVQSDKALSERSQVTSQRRSAQGSLPAQELWALSTCDPSVQEQHCILLLLPFTTQDSGAAQHCNASSDFPG